MAGWGFPVPKSLETEAVPPLGQIISGEGHGTMEVKLEDGSSF